MTDVPGFFAHESSCVDQPFEIGAGTRIWHFSHVMSGACIGPNNVSLYSGVVLEDGVFCGPSVVFTNVINPRARIERKHEFKATLVREGASLGANATIVCGVTIGAYAFVGAGAVVTRDVVPYAVVYGVPARQKGWVCECGVPLPDDETAPDLNCLTCAKKYSQDAHGLTRVT